MNWIVEFGFLKGYYLEMEVQKLTTRYRVLSAQFLESSRALVWRDRMGEQLNPALNMIVDVLARNLLRPPDEIDGQGLEDLMTNYLPGRLDGAETYLADLPDLLEDFMMLVNEAEGLAKAWDWTQAIDRTRDDFLAVLRNPDRPRYAAAKSEPERRAGTKIGRNDPCPCGSGKKYKRCCAQ